MFSDSTKQLLHLALLIGLIAAMAAIIPAGFGQDQKAPDTNKQYPHIDLDHPDNYIGQQVTLVGDVDKIHSDTAFVMEAKDQGTKDHILVIEISPDAHPEGEMKEGHPVTATGTIRRLDRAELEQEFGPIDFGTTPLAKFEGKPILVMGTRETAQVQQQEPVQQFEREKPTEPVTPVPAPEPQAAPDESLPRTATPLPFIGLTGLLSLVTGLGMQMFRRK